MANLRNKFFLITALVALLGCTFTTSFQLPEYASGYPMSPSYPMSQSPPDPRLGLLAAFAGTWQGNGFNLISLPDADPDAPSTGPANFRTLLSSTKETLTFTPVTGPIPNRGSLVKFNNLTSGQQDINIFGLQYIQQISDAQNPMVGLHIEPGFFLNIPSTQFPPQPNTIVRQGSIPHGTSVLLQSTFMANFSGRPLIANVSSIPSDENGNPLNGTYLNPLLNAVRPPGITLDQVLNPNILLRNAIANQTIINTIVVAMSTDPSGGSVDIPFLVSNANVDGVNFIIWIETVRRQDGSTFQQLQYSQALELDFLQISWPHLTVATLTKVN